MGKYAELIKRLKDVSMELGQVDHVSVLLLEAADAIEVLSKKENTTQWIPVTERLPRMWEEVMLRFPNNQAVGFHDGDSGWAVFSGDNMYTYVAPEEVHPTHWKPKEE